MRGHSPFDQQRNPDQLVDLIRLGGSCLPVRDLRRGSPVENSRIERSSAVSIPFEDIVSRIASHHYVARSHRRFRIDGYDVVQNLGISCVDDLKSINATSAS
jgi:hypothetical protein